MKKRYYWLIGILVGLIITNPTMQNFKDFKGTQASKEDFYDFSRDANLLFFSFYNDGFTREYIGICKNFFPVGNEGFKYYPTKEDSLKRDTTKDGLPILKKK